MNLEELKEKLGTISQMEGIGINVYFVLKAENGYVLKRADIIEDVKTNLIEAYQHSLNGIVENEDLSLLNLSEADDRQNAIYLYDLDQQPGIFDFFEQINDYNADDHADYFSFQDDDLADLEGYFIYVGDFDNHIMLYRKQMPINLFKQGKIYLVKGHETQFEQIDKEFLRIDSKIDIIQVEDSIVINNISILERHYEFTDIIEHEAEESIENIQNLNIVENIEVLQERIPDLAFARKLAKISTTSPVFNLPTNHIMQFVLNHPILGGEFRYNGDQSQILLDTKKSQNFFLKLMNDDFLHSQLTDYDYVTPAKDRLN